MTHILYSFRRCPYAMRARMALHISGADYEHREVILRDKPEAMLDASPKGTVPVFVKSGGGVIDESLDLMLWALEQNDPEYWLRHKDTALPFIATFEDNFKDNLDRYKYASRYDETKARGEVDLSYRKKAMAALEPLETKLNDAEFLGGSTRDIADIATFPFVRQFAAVERDWWAKQPLARVRDWLKKNIESELFKSIMKKHPLWEPED